MDYLQNIGGHLEEINQTYTWVGWKKLRFFAGKSGQILIGQGRLLNIKAENIPTLNTTFTFKAPVLPPPDQTIVSGWDVIYKSDNNPLTITVSQGVLGRTYMLNGAEFDYLPPSFRLSITQTTDNVILNVRFRYVGTRSGIMNLINHDLQDT